MSWPKVVFLHGRPGPHWIHAAFARAVNAQFRYVDASARWHDKAEPTPLRYAKWLANALAFPYNQYDALLVEGPHVWPPFGAKYLGHRPCYALIDNETPYFLWSGYLKGLSRWGILQGVARYTGLFIVGKMQLRLLQALLGEKMPPSRVLFNGVRNETLSEAIPTPALTKPVVLFLAHGPGGWRTYYKGLDLWVETIQRAAHQVKGLEGWVVGRWDDTEKERLLKAFPGAPVRFLGPMEDMSSIFPQASLYLHLGRGEAWGVAIMEAMAAGIPAIVSEWTGAAEVVEQAWSEGVVPLSAEKAAEAVVRYFSLTEAEKRVLSEKSATLIREKYRLSQAIAHFQSAFGEALKAVGLR